jgi:transcriptional regulator with XRE-family HTH domain
VLIKARVPLRGKEVKMLRKVLGFSLERFAAEIKLTSGSTFKWENKADERLHPINEFAVRALFAEKLGLEVSGKYSELIATPDKAKEIVLKAS